MNYFFFWKSVFVKHPTAACVSIALQCLFQFDTWFSEGLASTRLLSWALPTQDLKATLGLENLTRLWPSPPGPGGRYSSDVWNVAMWARLAQYVVTTQWWTWLRQSTFPPRSITLTYTQIHHWHTYLLLPLSPIVIKEFALQPSHALCFESQQLRWNT